MNTFSSMLNAVSSVVASFVAKEEGKDKYDEDCRGCKLDTSFDDTTKDCCFFTSMFQIIFVTLFENVVSNQQEITATTHMSDDGNTSTYTLNQNKKKKKYISTFSEYTKELSRIFKKKNIFDQYDKLERFISNKIIDDIDIEECFKKAFVVIQERFFQYDMFLVKRIDVDQIIIENVYDNEQNTYEYKKHKEFVQTRKIEKDAVKMYLHIPTIYYSRIKQDDVMFFSDPIFGDSIKTQFESVYNPNSRAKNVVLDVIPCGKQQSNSTSKTKLERMSILDMKCYIKRYGTKTQKMLVDDLKTRAECCALIASLPRANELFKKKL